MMISFHQTAIGRIGIAECGGAITNLYFSTERVSQQAENSETELIREAFRQIDAYLAGELRLFSVPLAPSGTPFMQHVWQILCTIPYGSTVSYREIAVAAKSPLAARAVGMANNRNPLPIFIPCHRVIGSNGELTGYRGGLGLKKRLLELESANIRL
jgi:methylated-DNA-[protein]-cysteine S-methyltransferase